MFWFEMDIFCILLLARQSCGIPPTMQQIYAKRLADLEETVERQFELLQEQSVRIQSLEHDRDSQRSENRALRKTIDKQNEYIVRLDEQIKEQNEDVEVLKTMIWNARDINKNGKHVKNSNSIINQSINNGNVESVSHVQLEESISRDARLLLPSATASTTKTVAFYAYMSKVETSPSTRHILLFDTVQTNVGGAYYPMDGIFTVPVKGVYGFSYSVRVQCHAWSVIEIIKNSDVIGVIIAHEPDHCNDYSTGNIITTANQGDIVYVRTHSTTHASGDIFSNTNGRPTFSGWLIGPDN